MKRAFVIHGPSGVGKTTLAKRICAQYEYVHCDADAFKLLFSAKRSKERSAIGEKICALFAKEVIARGHNVVIEVLPDRYLNRIKVLLAKERYVVVELSLVASLAHCVRNDARRTKRRYGVAVIEEVFPMHDVRRGAVIDVNGKKRRAGLRIREEKILLKRAHSVT